MLSWQEIVQNTIIKHSNSMKRVTRPLKEHFGIDYFTYHRVDNSGNYTVLLDRPEWAEHYVSEKIYLQDPYLRHPSVYKSGMCLIDSQGSPEYKKIVMKAGKKVLSMDLSVILIQKQSTHVDFFGFSGNQKTSLLQSLYMNRPKVLTSFAAHFRDELNPILRDQEPGSLLHLKGQDYLCDKPVHPDIDPEISFAFYRDLGMPCGFEKLSTRERQCLLFLAQAKSAKETAAALTLSPRTVEFYLENVKNKLTCRNKPEVLKAARRLEEAGLLP